MGRGSKIYHRFGLKWALAYRCKKLKRKIKNNTPLCLQKTLMFFRILKLKNANKFKIYKILIQCHCIIDKQKHLEFIAEHYEEINSWLNSKEFKEKYINTNHPYPPLLNPERLNAKVESCKDNKLSALSLRGTNKVRDEAIHNVAYFKDSIAESRMDKIMDCHDSTNAESCNDEYQSKSIESIQPYPNLSYESIPPELAWDLNLPLPPYYGFVYWGSHGCGNTGLQTFLRYCGAFECYYEPDIEVREIYGEYFDRIIQKSKQKRFSHLTLINLTDKPNGDKFYSLISCGFSLNLVRDPISMLKSYMGMKRLGKAKREITLHSNIDEVCKNLVRYTGSFGVIPDIEGIKMFINFRYICFHDTQLKNALINIQDSIVIDMTEIVGEKTFDTMTSLSKELGFPAPKEKYREKFKENIAKYGALLPLTLVVQSQKYRLSLYILDSVHKIEDTIYLTNIAATITREIEHCLDITQDLLHQSHFYNGIIVCIASKDWEILKRDSTTLQEVKDYLLKFIPRLQQQKEIEDKKKITELQVLEYFKEHKDLRIQFKQVLDKHLVYIKSVRPDIVESWKYYQEFERMCEELD